MRGLTSSSIEENPLASIVFISDIIAKSLLIGKEADCAVHPVANDVLKKICMPTGLFDEFLEHLYFELNKFNEIIKIDNRKFPQAVGRRKSGLERCGGPESGYPLT